MVLINAFLFFALSVTVLAADKATEQEKIKKIYRDCQKEQKIEQKELDDWGKQMKNPSEKSLCFLKCVADKDGTFDKNGKIVPDAVEKIINVTNYDDTRKAKVKSCLEKLPPVKKCNDMKGMIGCLAGGN